MRGEGNKHKTAGKRRSRALYRTGGVVRDRCRTRTVWGKGAATGRRTGEDSRRGRKHRGGDTSAEEGDGAIGKDRARYGREESAVTRGGGRLWGGLTTGRRK